MYMRVQEIEGAASHGVLSGMSLLGLSWTHEMGKHEIKVEKTHKRGWKEEDKSLGWCVAGGGWMVCSYTPDPRKHQAPQFHEKSPYEDLAVLPA